MIDSSRWNRRPLKGHGSHLQACERLGRQHLVAAHINIISSLCLRQYGLTLAKPLNGKEEARQSVVRATVMVLRTFPVTRHRVV